VRALAAFIFLGASAAHANPNSLVPSIADPGAYVGVAGRSTAVFFTIDYEYEQDTSIVLREALDPGTDPLGAVAAHRDLKFKQFRHTITPRVDVGIYHDFWFTAALPIIVTQARELSLDSGVTRDGSSTVRDAILPMEGFDAQDPGTALPGDLMFRGVGRHGLDYVSVGLGYALMNQAKDDTKPTWKLGADLHLSIGKEMKFDRMNPGAENGVSYGVHELLLWTSFDKKLGWAEPWARLFWQVPISAKDDSLFRDPGFGATNTQKGQQGGVSFGFEGYALDRPTEANKISLDVGARFVAHFEGRDYSELWEVFAFAGDSRFSGPLVLDADPTVSGMQPLSHPGISNIENYLESAVRFALRAELGPHVRFAALGDLAWKTDHVISFSDAGVDLPTCSGSRTTNCETDNNDLVNPGTSEVNPLHVQQIDLVGHRYRSENNFSFVIGVEGQVQF
jgi:hypothetical protein